VYAFVAAVHTNISTAKRASSFVWHITKHASSRCKTNTWAHCIPYRIHGEDYHPSPALDKRQEINSLMYYMCSVLHWRETEYHSPAKPRAKPSMVQPNHYAPSLVAWAQLFTDLGNIPLGASNLLVCALYCLQSYRVRWKAGQNRCQPRAVYIHMYVHDGSGAFECLAST
jgi:hypothetical protein